MGKNDLKKQTGVKMKYTYDMLLNDISELHYEHDDKAEREYKSKLIVMQMLIELANSFSPDYFNDDDKLANALDIKVNGDELLSGYLFFVSQNSQFDYSWNYMRKQRGNYLVFLADTIRFLNNVVIDINKLAEKPRVKYDIKVVFNDLIVVSLNNNNSYIKTRVLWDNFYLLATIKKNYLVSVKYQESLVVAGRRIKALDTEKLYDAALKMVNNTYNDSK